MVWHHCSLSKGKKLHIAKWHFRSALTLVIAIKVFFNEIFAVIYLLFTDLATTGNHKCYTFFLSTNLNPASRSSDFVNHLYDYKANWTITMTVLITNLNSSRSRRDEFFIYRSALPFSALSVFNAGNEMECRLTFCVICDLSFTSNLNSSFFLDQIHFHDTWR